MSTHAEARKVQRVAASGFGFIMLYTSIPNTFLKPSVLSLGVAEHGSSISVEESWKMLDAYAEAGGNMADTAHVYAAWLPEGKGQSERTLGQWIRSRQAQTFLVATKGGHPDLATMDISRLSPDDIARDIDQSLERLQLDSIDLLYLHRDDPQIPVNEIMDALNTHVASGRVRALGASNWSSARIAQANEYASKRDLTGFCISQIGWSLAQVNPDVRGAGLTIQMDDELLAWHRQSGFPIAAYSSQANGFFAYPLPDSQQDSKNWTDKQKSLAHSYLNPRNSARHDCASRMSTHVGRTPNEIALAYIWSQSFPSIAIIGPRRLEPLQDSLRAGALRLSPDAVAQLETAD